MYGRVVAGFLRDEEPEFSLRQFVVPMRLTLEIERMLAGGVTRRMVGDLDGKGARAVEPESILMSR
jgi:hypothetical protein